MLGNLHRRIGDEDTRVEGQSVGERRAWGRLIGADLNVQQHGTVSPTSSGHLDGFQTGTDLLALPAAGWRAGVYVGQVDGYAGVSGFARGVWGPVGSSDSRSQYLAGYATYMPQSGALAGFYADAVLQLARHNYTLHPNLNLPVSGKGSGVQASIEVGQSFGLGAGWSIEPQAQLVYQRVNLDDVSIVGALVQQHADSGWLARIGARVKGEFATGIGMLKPYGRVNLYHASSGTDTANFIGPAGAAVISSGAGYTASEVAAGFTLGLTPAVSVYGEVGRMFSSGGESRVKSSALGSLGVRVRW
jgi:outer membrane autotransporter protein